MLDGTVRDIRALLKFTLSNGSKFYINSNDNTSKNNYITSFVIKEAISSENNIPIGINTANNIILEMISNDRVLIPDNKNSAYYNYMNDTAIIDVLIYENSKECKFGRYFVTSWKSNITSETPNKIIIEAIDLMGLISKCDVPDININFGMKIKDFVTAVVNELNNKLDEQRKIKYIDNDIKFDAFQNMQFCNLDIDNIGKAFNELSQCTLTNIYIDREGYIKTDYVCDDTVNEAKYKLDVMTAAECGTGILVNYDGVKVKYSLGKIKDIEQLASLYDYELNAGGNLIEDISLGNSVYKINRIEVVGKDNEIFVGITSAKYNKKKMTLTLDADKKTKVNIIIYGQRLDDTELIKETTDGKNKLEINNKIIESKLIRKYINNMYDLIRIKNNSMKITGYFTPDIKLSDIVYVNVENAMNISGYYKVVGLEWDMSSYGLCVMSLIKTFELKNTLDYICNDIGDLMLRCLLGQVVTISDFDNINQLSEKDNNIVEKELKNELTLLREML